MENKFTDDEIIKALNGNILNAKSIDCKVWSIEVYKLENALDLINRQKAENEMLKDLITYQKQKIKEKEQKYNQAVDDMFGLIETTRNEIAEAKSEARKEFAERIKQSATDKSIDELLEEMEGEDGLN